MSLSARPSAITRAQQVEVAVQLPPGKQQVTQLAVVDAHVGVNELPRGRPHGVLHVVEHHVGVVDDAASSENR